MLCFDSLSFFGLKSGLSEGSGEDRLAIRAHDHLLGSKFGCLFCLLSHGLPPLFLLVQFCDLEGILSLLFLLSALLLLLFALLLGRFALESIFLLLEFALAHLLSLLLLQVADEALARDVLALKALPDTLGHALQVCAEQVIRLFAAAAVNEVARVLAFEAIIGIRVWRRLGQASVNVILRLVSGQDFAGRRIRCAVRRVVLPSPLIIVCILQV
mmetsp:Transcript_2210/g.2903  ORF Transcript_2210/g.2903 Transcript_2210/m.2903 type:complete len:214 (-) Transcript_2210:320-961(-)